MRETVPTEVIIGVDTHKDVHAAAIDAFGVPLGTKTIPASSKGYQALEAWAVSLGPIRAVGIEGTGSYGAGLSRFLRERGHVVFEVNRSNRQLRRQKGKSDTIDAESAARAVLGGQATALPKSGTSAVEMIRHLKVARDTAVKARTQAMQTLKAIIVSAPAALREQLDPVTGKMTLIRRLAAMRPGTIDSTTASAKASLRAISRRWLALDAEIKEHDSQLEALTAARAPKLVEAHGMATDTACEMLLLVGDDPRSASARRPRSPSCAAPAPSRPPAARPSGTGSTAAATVKPTPPSTGSSSRACAATDRPSTTSGDARPRAKASPRSCAASSATWPARSSAISASRRSR